MDSRNVNFRMGSTGSARPALREVYGLSRKPATDELVDAVQLADCEDCFDTILLNHRVVRRLLPG